MAVNTTPILSWYDYPSMIPSNAKFRERYTRTKDPLPNMCYKQLEDALPSSYNLPMGEEPMDGVEELPPETEGKSTVKELENHVSLAQTRGLAGDEITIEADWGLTEITVVCVNGIKAEFVVISDSALVFEIPQEATSGTVELTGSDGKVTDVGNLTVACD